MIKTIPKRIVRTSQSQHRFQQGKHRFEHWHVDNQVYFITARCTQRFTAFADGQAKAIFWDRFTHYTQAHGFTPWVTSLLDNHYHTIGYLREGKELPKMMQHIHGSVAKLVNDHLRENNVCTPWLAEPKMLTNPALPAEPASAGGPNANQNPRAQARSAKLKFWGDRRGHEYFDGCLRDTKQGRLTYRYILNQCRRHGVCNDPNDYPHTRINVQCERAIKRAVELDAFLTGVPYKRYQNPKPN